MSVEAVQWVWRHSRAAGNARLVLVYLAWRADPTGADAHPAHATILAATGVRSVTTLRSAIKTLEGLGEVVVFEGRGARGAGGRTNRYDLPMVPGYTAPADFHRGLWKLGITEGGTNIWGHQDLTPTPTKSWREPLPRVGRQKTEKTIERPRPQPASYPQTLTCDDCGGSGWAMTKNRNEAMRCTCKHPRAS